ncbi:hypothetical protein [Actinopolymorpha pittospori]
MPDAASKPVPEAGDVPDLLGLLEISVLFDISHGTADTWRTRAKHGRALAEEGEDTSHLFPEPDVTIGEISTSPKARTPVWRRDRIEAWGEYTGKPMHPDRLDQLRAERAAERAEAVGEVRAAAEKAREKARENKRRARARHTG